MDARPCPAFRTQETRHESWREAVASLFLPLDFDVSRSTPFHGRALWARLEHARAAEVRMCEHRVTRRPRHSATSDVAAVKMLWLLHGQGRFQQGSEDRSLVADGWTFYDASRPYSLHLSEDARFFSLLYTGENAESWMRLARDLGPACRPNAGPARIALLALRGAMREQEGLTPLAQRALLESVLALTESALRQEADQRQGGDRRDTLRLAEARRFVLQHLAEPALGPDDIARALHMSRRSLYNLFAAAELRPRAFIQNLRLERACEALIAGGPGEGSITRIALEHGFADGAHFSRSFRERFGVSPSAYRSDRRPAG